MKPSGWVLTTVLIISATICRLSAQGEDRKVLRGRIVDDISGEAVPQARITISGGSLLNPVLANSDAAGEFAIADLSVGSYRVNVDKAGFFPYVGSEAVTSENASHASATIQLITKRVIKGAVSWEDGDPAFPAGVVALRVGYTSDGVQLRAAGSVTTNEAGDFRLGDLQPGRYVLAVGYEPQHVRGDVAPRIIPWIFSGNTNLPDVSSSLDLKAQRESLNVRFELRERPGYDVRGSIEPSSLSPLGSPVYLLLMSVTGLADLDAFISYTGHVGERFEFPGVPPGEYDLISSTIAKPYYRGVYRLLVRDSAVDNLKIYAPVAAPIKGKVELIRRSNSGNEQGRATTNAGVETVPPPTIRILKRSNRLGLYGRSGVNSDVGGEFLLSDTALGESSIITVTALPKNTYVASVTQGSVDVLANGSAVVDGGDFVHVLLKDDPGEITGSILGPDGSPRRGFVVLAPKNRKYASWFRTSSSTKDGAFDLPGIAPGDYDLFVLEDNEDDRYFDSDYLMKFGDGHQTLTVPPDGKLSVTVNSHLP